MALVFDDDVVSAAKNVLVGRGIEKLLSFALLGIILSAGFGEMTTNPSHRVILAVSSQQPSTQRKQSQQALQYLVSSWPSKARYCSMKSQSLALSLVSWTDLTQAFTPEKPRFSRKSFVTAAKDNFAGAVLLAGGAGMLAAPQITVAAPIELFGGKQQKQRTVNTPGLAYSRI
jgi:hypothetical protein